MKTTSLILLFSCHYSENSGRTSPSTQEAIAGMLSISQTYVQPGRSSRSKKTRTFSLSEEDDLNNVHQDDDYSKTSSLLAINIYQHHITSS